MNSIEFNESQSLKTIWILWAALLFSQFVFLFLKLFMFSHVIEGGGVGMEQMQMFFMAAILPAGISIFFWTQAKGAYNAITPQSENPQQLFAKASSLFLVSMATAEAIGIFGLITAMQGDMEVKQYSHGLSLLGIVLGLFYIPKNTFSKRF